MGQQQCRIKFDPTPQPMGGGGASNSILHAKSWGRVASNLNFYLREGRRGSSSVGSNSILHPDPWERGGGVELNPRRQVLREGSIEFKFLPPTAAV